MSLNGRGPWDSGAEAAVDAVWVEDMKGNLLRSLLLLGWMWLIPAPLPGLALFALPDPRLRLRACRGLLSRHRCRGNLAKRGDRRRLRFAWRHYAVRVV